MSETWSWGHESTEVHTRILRLALGVDESRGYWEHVDPDVVGPERVEAANEAKWFGDKSAARVKFLLSAMQERFDAFPNALDVLRRWSSGLDDDARRAICHWHVQLADPIYRRFTGELLPKKRASKKPELDFAVVEAWVESKYPGRWSAATVTQFASKLLSTATEAGLVSGKRDTRTLESPKIPDRALSYLLYLLRETRFKGTLVANPYLASVGIDDVHARVRAGVPGIAMGDDLIWASPNLAAFGESRG